MSQIGILTPDWSFTAFPCYSPEWKIAFGVNDEANKTRVCSKITRWNNFFLKYVINNDILQLCLQKFHFLDQKQLKYDKSFSSP